MVDLMSLSLNSNEKVDFACKWIYNKECWFKLMFIFYFVSIFKQSPSWMRRDFVVLVLWYICCFLFPPILSLDHIMVFCVQVVPNFWAIISTMCKLREEKVTIVYRRIKKKFDLKTSFSKERKIICVNKTHSSYSNFI